MSISAAKAKISKTDVSTADAFYRIFCALSKKDRLAVARHIFQDEEIREFFDLNEIPNESTRNAFAEKKTRMPIFESIHDLCDDLLS